MSLVLAVVTGALFFWLVFGYFSVVLCHRKRWLVVIGCFCGFLCVLRLGSYDDIEASSLNKQIEGQKVSLNLTLLGDTIQINGDRVSFDAITADKQKLRVSLYLKKQEQQQQWQDFREQTLAMTVTGTWTKGTLKRNLHGFSYQEYLKNNGYRGAVTIAAIENFKPVGHSNLKDRFFALVRRIRGYMINHVEERFYPVTGSYIKALLFGFKDPEFQLAAEGFKKAGILHLFSISGMHLLFFFGLLDKLFRRIGLTKGEAYLPMCLCLAAGWLLFGASSSVSRAVLLYFVTRTLKLVSIQLSAMDRFAIVLLILQLVWPRFLLTTGGQLSLYMAWLLTLLPRAVTLKEQLLQGLQLTLLPAPLLMYLFYEWSLIGGLLTVCCLPLFSHLLLPGFLFLTLTSVIGLTLPVLFSELLENALLMINYLLQGSGFVSVITGKPTVMLVVFCLLVGLLLIQQKNAGLWQLAVVCFLLPLIFGRFPLNKIVAFVDVGQGDSIVVKDRFNQQVTVIDTGGRLGFAKEEWAQGATKAAAEYSLIPFLKGEGVTRIHQLVLTHGDSDHMGDAAVLFRHFQIDELIIGKGAFTHPNLSQLLTTIPSKTKITQVTAGDLLNDTFSMQALAPAGSGKGENEDSVVLTARVGQQRFLFTGDLGKEGEGKLLKRFSQLKVDVLKVGHHGSRTSSDANFLSQIQPEDVIISAGFENRFGHPHQEVLDTLTANNCHILRTDLQGMIYYSYSIGEEAAAAKVLVIEE